MSSNIFGTTVNVDGLGLGNCQPVIAFPSGQIAAGQPGRDLEAILIQINAQFGFNTQPHTFNTSWVPTRDDPEAFHGASGQAPSVGTTIGFTIDEFLVSGEIIHSEYNVTNNGGTILNINIRDTRSCLDAIKIITEDLGNNPGSGVISVARGTRITKGFTDINGNVSEVKFQEYRKILEQGATYPQILDAIQLAIDEGEISFDLNKIPTKQQLEANLGGDASAIRFQFKGSPLTEVITRVLESSAYDWYWSMSEQKVQLINRKIAFTLAENDLLDIVSSLGASSGLDQTIRIAYGDDLVTQPRRVRLLGAHQEGWINSPLLGLIDGIDTPSSGVVFMPAWHNFTVQFTDAAGILRSYTPSDLELQAALKGIEHWTYFKRYQTAPLNLTLESPGFGLSPDAGSIAAQHVDFQSRIDPARPIASLGGNESGQFRLINNRRDANQNWVINFFNRVQDHANRFFGRAYIASGILANEVSGAFTVANQAWGNVENQVEGQTISVAGSSGLFVDNYEINRDLGPLAPFKGSDNKIASYCVLPAGTVYGPDGEDPPASFGSWTEDFFFAIDPITGTIAEGGLTTAQGASTSGHRTRTGEHYVPIRLIEVGQLSIDPRDPLAAFESYPEGTVLAELPIMASSGLSPNTVFKNLVTLTETALETEVPGPIDILDPGILVEPYNVLSGVAIPVIFTKRYGMDFPSEWASGTLQTVCDNEVVVIDDQFAPWNFPPQGRTTSVQLMEDRAFRRLQGLIAPAANSQFAQIEIVGLPKISFDAFSNQTPDINGNIGIRNHGVTNINFSLGTNGIRSTYRIASFFAEFGEDPPLAKSPRAILNGIITPIDTQIGKIGEGNSNRQRPTPPNIPFVGRVTGQGETTRRATITEVNFALTFSDTPDAGTQERYRGRTQQQYTVPPKIAGSIDPDFENAAGQGGAVCIDGFLNLGDEAVYHVNEFRLPGQSRAVQRFWTGGRPFANATIVEVIEVGTTSSVFNVAIENTDPLRKLVDVPLLNGVISVGDKTTLATQANAPVILSRPTSELTIDGVFLNPGGGSTSIPVQVVSITNPGTSGALVNVQGLTDNGDVNTAASIVSGLVPIPFPHFIIVGDKGTFFQASVLNTNPTTPGDGSTATTKFFVSNRQNFVRFT